ncbi:uncharacterized protein [Venturia canescens]|uniref:uncharacterized protein n=1 Tax=Venturia canescens TaxID=32260 RepID=UPI001C9CE229|nr:uncharacterized protein LOC122408583 [Venturia canescens]
MESKIYLPAVALVLALAVTSADALRCYECKSVGSTANDECSGEMLKKTDQRPIECSVDTMIAWHNRAKEDYTLNPISNVFEVFNHNNGMSHHRDPHTPMACVKIDLKVDNQPVTLRTCQTAKTAEVDPCKATRDKISKMHRSSTVVVDCNMCETDECNGSYALSPTMIMAMVPLIGSILMSLGYSSA